MFTERLISKGSFQSHHYYAEPTRIFDELPKATILSVSRPDVSDIGPLLLSYTIQIEYKQVTTIFHLSSVFLNYSYLLTFIRLGQNNKQIM